MKRQIVTTVEWDFARYGMKGEPSNLPAPQAKRGKIREIFSGSQSGKETSEPVYVKSLSISSSLWKNKWPQRVDARVEFGFVSDPKVSRNLFRGVQGEFTNTFWAVYEVYARLCERKIVDGSMGTSDYGCRMEFHLSPKGEAFCEEAITRGSAILLEFGLKKDEIRYPMITQETYVWVPMKTPLLNDLPLDRWMSYGEMLAIQHGFYHAR